MSRIAGWVAFASLLVLPIAWSAAAEVPATPAPLERLIEQLGDPDYRVRDAASKALEAMGTKILPALRKAQAHSDPEVRRRVEILIAPMEKAVILAPKRVSLNVVQKPIREAVAAVSKQAGYKIDLYPEAQANGEREKLLYTLRLEDVTFWEALDRLCAEAGLSVQEGYGNDAVRMQFDDNRAPFVSRNGPFRVLAQGFHYSRSVHFANVPRDQPLLGQRSEYLNFTVGVSVEPRLPLLGLGQVKLLLALDEKNNSMLPPQAGGVSNHYHYGGYKSFNLQANVNLTRPFRDAQRVQHMQGVLPLTLLIEQKADIVVEPVLSAKGKKFKAADVELDIEDVTEQQNKVYQIKMAVKRIGQNNTNDYSWSNSLYQRIELHDAKGNKYQPRGYGQATFSPTAVSGQFQFGDSGNGQLGPPAKLVYYTWITMQHQVTFDFKDLPLP